MSGVKRILAEWQQMQTAPPAGCGAQPINETNLYEWRGFICGPPGTPYEGGKFELQIMLPQKYPFEPPFMKFVTPPYHCNIDANGLICLDILKDKWAPVLTISKVLLSLCSLLNEPNPNSCLRADIGLLLTSNKAQHDENARQHTRLHAMQG